ncbi:MAG: tetratricopeptide repeat protein, partial [Verrucomicrobiota bacterium]|nr:tetratricopeptide repeat protein [Verrucomicrobiota bacterium]
MAPAWWIPLLAPAVLVLAVFVVYLLAWNGGFLWEDRLYASTNPLLTAADGWWKIWFTLESPAQYFPLTHTVFRLEKIFWGSSLTSYHLLNIALHAGGALVLWRLLRRLEIPAPWLGAALFALHPVQVETVAQISELKNVLMGLCFLASLFFWVRFRADRQGKWWIASFVCCLLALAAKSNACVLPAVFLLILWWRRERLNWKTCLESLPFAVASAGAAFVAILWEHLHNTAAVVADIGSVERGLIASRAIFFYLGKLLWPFHLTFNYPAWNISRSDPADYLWVGAVVLLATAIYLARRRLGRGPEMALLFFVICLSPFLGFVVIYTFRFSYVADHYQYLASIGPLVLAGAACEWIRGKSRSISWILPGVVLALIAFLSWREAAHYKNGEALWAATVQENPQSWMGENNYGTVLADRGDERSAFAHYQRAYELAPKNFESASNMGGCLMDLHQPVAALPYLEQAVRINDRDPKARGDLGRALIQLGRVSEAISSLEQFLTFVPRDAAAHTILASALVLQGRTDEALAHLRTALAEQPDDPQTLTQLANLYLRTQQNRQAAEMLRHIL